MSVLKVLIASFFWLTSLTSFASPDSETDDDHGRIVHARDLVWVSADGLPEGSMMAVLFGDPAATGPLILRVRVPADTVINPHFHPQDEWVTAIEGKAKLGMGETLDLDAAEAFEAGDLHFLPGGHPHFVKTTTQTTVEIHTTGPWGITFIEGNAQNR